jgi:hypothetical protein
MILSQPLAAQALGHLNVAAMGLNDAAAHGQGVTNHSTQVLIVHAQGTHCAASVATRLGGLASCNGSVQAGLRSRATGT